ENAGRWQLLFLAEKKIVRQVRLDLVAAIEPDWGGRFGSAFETFRNAGTESHMSGTGEDHHPAALVGAQIRGGAFRHSFVPHQLRLDKVVESFRFRGPMRFER